MVEKHKLPGGFRTLAKEIRRFFNRKESTEYYWKQRMAAMNGGGLKKFAAIYRHKMLMRRNNAFIPVTASIAEAPTFPHGIMGIFISGGATIGKGCTIFHQVTIGSNTLPDSKNQGVPVIGDNVFIGCGAKIIGNVKIGNNVRIGANCVVTQDIPDNCTVVLPSPRIIVHNTAQNNHFLSLGEYEQRSLK